MLIRNTHGGGVGVLDEVEVHDPQEKEVRDLWRNKSKIGSDVNDFVFEVEIVRISFACREVPLYRR